MSEWQPIETAPKDGTRVLASQSGHVFTARWAPGFAAVYPGGGGPGWYDEILDRRAQPTHWMPLPAPPNV